MCGESTNAVPELVSVIVPVYNASRYLGRCLGSLLRQSYTCYEVLLINDGSTDDSGKICDTYADRYSRVEVYHMKNGGVSAARNMGLEKAKGSYITFVDADDYVDENYLSLLLPHGDEDFSVCGVKILSPNGTVAVEGISAASCGTEARQRVVNHHLVRAVWGKMFKRSVIDCHGIRFDTAARVGEDTLFVLEYLSVVSSVFITDKAGYVYISPGYKIDKYRTTPDDLVALYASLCECESKLRKKGLDVFELEKRNRNVVGFNLLTALYLVKKYPVNIRSKYIGAFKNARKLALEDMGLPRMVAKGMRFVERTGSAVLTDRCLLFFMKLIWLKAKMLKH
ncbi:glycosyltransferase [Niabella sp. CC-SYL272]|uniref:glycosyltransferase family 2 protein n=1 Tax=Niabella agricola TaxID=2891571 RepID=UPI001F30D891|nr:glycosyltransferase [Niabella agricola]MCF3112119.1 glycosyltransferase [Niabella agricola]